ncbi:Transcription initiation factor TFIID subunit 3 [Araneus ventricosus]|uniref:Transcription initiation factor TFIID subunit 3 n=1 Tax=Araneus ventricosus TaxID=182803 RepID=A0A4Y2JZ34_ARAVE|nr:Transcription initiation factor TFIID subunit 3 [Araneus ventricosus]
MADCEIAKQALKVVVAQICQNIGWHAVQSSPMDILVDVLQRYVLEIAKSVHGYSTQYNRTEPNLDDLGLTFKDFGINLQEIEEYINNVEPVPAPYKIAAFPVKHPSNLQIPKPDSRELLARPEHIPSYLPLMHPDLEEDVFSSQHNSADGVKKNSVEAGVSGDSPSPLSSPKHGSRPGETNKRSRYYTEEEGRPMREVTSVFMTPTGFISPIHEGKSAEASLPCLVDSPPPTPEQPSHSFTPVSSKKDAKVKDVKKDKSKSKKDKETSKKDLKKLKSSKKEKENKENAVSKHEKSVTSTSGSKKEHTSSHKSAKVDKSMKSDDPVRQKSKSDKMKLKAQKDELRKIKESFKLSKMKAKLKHTGGSSSSSHIKSPKLSSSKKLKAARVAKSVKHFKGERNKSVEPEPALPSPVPVLPKEIPVEQKPPPVEPKVEKEVVEEPMEEEELDFREESPESRLVIDDSLETQARQERESRLEVIDECIEAVIRRGEEESEVENKAMDETINSVVRGPVVKKLEPKDIYDFTDTSDSSSLSSCDMTPHSPIQAPVKKEKKTSESAKKSSESPKRSKKDKSKKKASKDSKVKSPYSSPKSQKSSSFMLKVEDRTPSPLLRDDLLSDEGSTPSSSPRSNSFFDQSPQAPSHAHAPPLLTHVPPLPPPLVPGSSYTSSPFAPMRSLHTNPHFPTPPLFVTPSKSEGGNSFQNMPLNLAKSGPSSQKSSPEKFESNVTHSTVKSENSDIIKKAANIIDKAKAKDHKKDKIKKKGKKESEKVNKKKEEKEEIREKEKPKPKEKPKTKSEKNVKVDKKKSKPDKKKTKEKEEKVKEDSTVPKMTLKLTSSSGSTKICVKPNTKNSASLSSSPSPSHDSEEEIMRTPSPAVPIPSPSPPREPTPPPPPPPPRIPTPPPPSPSPPPPVIKEEPVMPAPPPPVTKTTHSRGRGRGKKAAVAVPAPRTVITETVGTIVDESGNKIWICPACSRADDGSPMIGCDECDDWYHWGLCPLLAKAHQPPGGLRCNPPGLLSIPCPLLTKKT